MFVNSLEPAREEAQAKPFRQSTCCSSAGDDENEVNRDGGYLQLTDNISGMNAANRPLTEPNSLAIDPQMIKAFDEPDFAEIRLPILGLESKRVSFVAHVHRPFLGWNQGFQTRIGRDLQP